MTKPNKLTDFDSPNGSPFWDSDVNHYEIDIGVAIQSRWRRRPLALARGIKAYPGQGPNPRTEGSLRAFALKNPQ